VTGLKRYGSGVRRPEHAIEDARYGAANKLRDKVDFYAVKSACRDRRADGARGIDAAAGQRAEHQDAYRHGHADRERSEPTCSAAHRGVQDRVDQEEGADRLEREGAPIGDALGVNERRAEMIDRPSE
jgi:hypothetical protein